jgi:amino acid transporter
VPQNPSEARASTLTTRTSNLLGTTATTIQTRSRELRKELRLGDLALACLLFVVVPDFFGTALKAGNSHVLLWLIALLFFFVPQALVVTHLNRRLPLEGGLYEWARLAFNDRAGFLVAWNLWVFNTLYVGVMGMVTVNYLVYAIGPRVRWMQSSHWIISAVSLVAIGFLMLLARVGLRFSKWLTNVGSILTIVTVVTLAVTPFIKHAADLQFEYHPLRFTVPPLSLFTLSVFSKMTFGALCGLEYMAIFSSETHNPSRLLPRAISLTAVPIVLLYVFGTSGILAFVSPNSADMVAPIPQALSLGLQGIRYASFLVPLSIGFLLINYLSTFGLNFAGNSRLPMVAGWDHLLPEWFTRLHPKHRTPVNSILFLGAVAALASLATLIGVGEQEAFELLQILAFTFYGIAYLAMFAIPLLARKETGLRPKLWLRLAALSGFLVSLLFVFLSAFPIIPVANPTAYSIKTVSVILGANAIGLLLYGVGSRKATRTVDR